MSSVFKRDEVKFMPWCVCCGRADQRLQCATISQRMRIDEKMIQTEPVLNLLSRQFEQCFFEETICKECFGWLEHLEAGGQSNPGKVSVWGISWALYVGHALTKECAMHVWLCLSSELRVSWRFVKLPPKIQNMVECVKMMCPREIICKTMTLNNFHRMAEFDYDTKCAICRGAFPSQGWSCAVAALVPPHLSPIAPLPTFFKLQLFQHTFQKYGYKFGRSQ